ncbi:MAG: Similar to eukaryotic Peptidyl prolyl 4-hydroxylase, alpha subunit (EC [uncultured Paraburkholderia sp.]|nr:MAG: Similar to eukaryotic Peptidyl prolyl 4-hydroxylase, alpha subunit (EC [uncultured Paraburkholderia sp.]
MAGMAAYQRGMDSMIEAMVQAGFAVDAASEAVRGAFGLSASATSAAATSAASAGGTEAALPQAARRRGQRINMTRAPSRAAIRFAPSTTTCRS